MADEGCSLSVTESKTLWVCTGNDSSPENGSRLVRACDASGAILGYRMTPTPILAVRMYKPDNVADDKAHIVIVTQLNIFVYDAGLEHCKLIIDTESNPHGAIAVSSQEPFRIAYPCPSAKGVKVSTINGEDTTYFQNTFSTHLQLLAFSPSGRKLAATDQDGLTVYSLTFPDVQNGISTTNIKSYRRGAAKCRMTSLCYNSADEDILCCSSDHGTTHVFNINPSTSLLALAPGSVVWNFQIKDDKKPSSPLPSSSSSSSSSSPSPSLATTTSWCHFSSDSAHLYRVHDSRVYIYHLDLNQARPGATLLIVKELSSRK